MRLDENYEEQIRSNKGNSFVVIAFCCMAVFIVAVVGVVLLLNKDKIFGEERGKTVTEGSSSEIPIDSLISGSKLESDDLDIWVDYMEEEEEKEKPSVSTEREENDPSEGGTKTLLERRDGSSEWVKVNSYLPVNDYENSGFALLNDRMAYYEDGIKISYQGIEVSKYQGYVDFNEVKRDGIDYVMIRLGQRGYTTGQLVLDDYFSDNIKRATDAGLDVGVVWHSQAITEEEAEEEADFVLQYLQDWNLAYPVAFVMEHVENDSARIDALTKEDKTRIAKAFLQKIDEAGYIGIIYGDKEWMFEDINYAALSNYGTWLNQIKDIPDYPYRFQMWRYTTVGDVEGVSGSVAMSISFVDYTIK